MATIYKPTRVLPDGRRMKYQYYRIVYIDEAGQRRSCKGFKDKAASEAKAREIEKRIERIQAGLPVATHEKLNQPLHELFDEYLAELRQQGRSDSHCKEQQRLLRTLQAQCGWKNLRTVRAESLRKRMHSFSPNAAARTINSYRDAAVSFCNWCVRQDWLQENPLTRIPKAREPGNRKHQPRRAFTSQEFKSLLEANPGRRNLYFAAGLSGLRKGELRQLEKRDLSPLATTPTWHLRPEIAKGRRRDVVPILPDLLPELQKLWRAKKQPTERLFGNVPRNRTFHADLIRAGIVRIDDEGRRVVFHSLRYFFCTLLAKHLPIQVVRLLMRHKNIKQTCDLYMDLGLTDVAEAVIQLPPMFLDGPN